MKTLKKLLKKVNYLAIIINNIKILIILYLTI